MKRFWLTWETMGADSRQMRALNSFCDGIGWTIVAEVLANGGSEMDALEKVNEEAAAEGFKGASFWIEY